MLGSFRNGSSNARAVVLRTGCFDLGHPRVTQPGRTVHYVPLESNADLYVIRWSGIQYDGSIIVIRVVYRVKHIKPREVVHEFAA